MKSTYTPRLPPIPSTSQRRLSDDSLANRFAQANNLASACSLPTGTLSRTISGGERTTNLLCCPFADVVLKADMLYNGVEKQAAERVRSMVGHAAELAIDILDSCPMRLRRRLVMMACQSDGQARGCRLLR